MSEDIIQTADDNNKVTSQAIQITSLHIFEFVLHSHSTVISNQIKYQEIRRNLIDVIFCTRSMAFT